MSHSFGSFIATAYIHKYPEKIAGIIEFGCVPIHVHTSLKAFGKEYIFGDGDRSYNYLIKNIERIYEEYKAWRATRPAKNLVGLITKYRLLAFYLILGADRADLWEWRRQYPKIWKLITFGRRDTICE